MFLALLSDAKESVEKDTHVRSSFKADAKEKFNSEKKTNEGSISHHLSHSSDEAILLEKCSEYLFDLFEANLTPEYRRLNVIQDRAIACFNRSLEDEITRATKSSIVEYTFEQQNIHGEFKDVFEQLIGDFLFDEKISVNNFYSLVEKCALPARKSLGILTKTEKQKKFADEILDTIYWYTDFECWATAMRAEASYRRNMKLIREDELDAANGFIDSTGGTSASADEHLDGDLNERLL
jgi:The ARF-like 2 binding protein BART